MTTQGIDEESKPSTGSTKKSIPFEIAGQTVQPGERIQFDLPTTNLPIAHFNESLAEEAGIAKHSSTIEGDRLHEIEAVPEPEQ